MRMSAVQTDTQFVYVVRCLLAYATTCGVLQFKSSLIPKANKFEAEYEAHFAAKTVTPAEATEKDSKTANEVTKASAEQPDAKAAITITVNDQIAINTDASKENMDKKSKETAEMAGAKPSDTAKHNEIKATDDHKQSNEPLKRTDDVQRPSAEVGKQIDDAAPK
ncbi:unnamed protein product, partial [Anisakis simplex]|uniref:Uncharacterized protein n=1 Tax=Anisakis simplex TaxID=6269 RepID=A0A0M3JG91_ANISI